MSSKLAPTKITDSDKTKMGQENVCQHFKVGYCKYETKCRHKHIDKECQTKSCNKRCQNRHIKICRYGKSCKRINVCQFKHNLKEKYAEEDKIKKIILEEKEKVKSLQTEILCLKIKIEEQMKSLNNVTIDKERVTSENIKLTEERDLLKVKIKEQQEEIFELKSNVITIKVEQEKLQHEIDTIKNIKVNKVENTQHMLEVIKCTTCKDTNVVNGELKKVSGEKQKHEQASHDKSPPVMEEAFKCKSCEVVCSQADSLRKHTIKEHKNICDKCYTTFKDQEAKHFHMWDKHQI